MGILSENERLREHLGIALGLYHLGQTTGHYGSDNSGAEEAVKARESAYGFVCAITNEGWIDQDEWPIWARLYKLEFEEE